MSDTSQGPGWWLASDGRWYPPEQHPSYLATMPPPPVMAAPPVAPYPPGYGPPPGAAASTGRPLQLGRGVQVMLAPWWKRLVAWIIDGAVLGIPLFICFAIVGALSQKSTDYSTYPPTTTSSSAAGGVVILVLVVLGPLLYTAIMNGSRRGQTVGKMALQIAVRDNFGGPIGFWRGVARYLMTLLFWIVGGIPGILDGLSPLWDSRLQSWHDHVVSSVVVDVST